jgi:hypothetical protein
MSSSTDVNNNNNNTAAATTAAAAVAAVVEKQPACRAGDSGSGSGSGSGVKLHPWIRPKPLLVHHDARLKILNSLTREKEHFLTIDGSNHVTWYMYV